MTREELQKFCVDSVDARQNIARPWSRGGWSYATNRHILLRVPRLADVEENPIAPDCDKLMQETAPATNWMPVPIVHERIGMRVGNAFFDRLYLSWIQGWEISPAGPHATTWIRNGDVLGLIMPMRE